jgi:DNA (cytosine-5)-methyltransferase 1
MPSDRAPRRRAGPRAEAELKPLLLDLCCCAGCASRGYADAGFDVVGVDVHPQPNYPYPFLQADALEVLRRLLDGRSVYFVGEGNGAGYHRLSDFAAIHASFPCQGYTGLNNDKSQHPRLIEPGRVLLEETGLPYVIENVEGAKSEMLDPVVLHGWHFGLNVARKRLFETNWELPAPTTRTRPEREFLVYEHGHWRWTRNVPVYGNGGRKAVEYWPFAMGVGSTWDDAWMTRDELAEAIPPTYTLYVGGYLLEAIHSRTQAAA